MYIYITHTNIIVKIIKDPKSHFIIIGLMEDYQVKCALVEVNLYYLVYWLYEWTLINPIKAVRQCKIDETNKNIFCDTIPFPPVEDAVCLSGIERCRETTVRRVQK